MVNRQASSARASWRCRAWSSWASAISGATTSRTRCASRRSATGSCSAAHPIRCASASRRCSTGNASTPLTITTACSSDTLPAAIASLTGSWSWSRALRELQPALRVPPGLPGPVGPVAARVGGTGRGAEVEPVGVAGVAELELGDLVPQRGQRGQVGLGLGGREGPQPEVGDLVQQLGDGGDRGRHRVLSGVVECRCHTGNSGIRHRQSRSQNRGSVRHVDNHFRPFLVTWMWWSRHSLAGARCSTSGNPSTLARWRSLLDQREPVDTRSLALARSTTRGTRRHSLAGARCSTSGELSRTRRAATRSAPARCPRPRPCRRTGR